MVVEYSIYFWKIFERKLKNYRKNNVSMSNGKY